MQRRKFITLAGGAAATSLLAPPIARAQRQMPTIGYLHIGARANYVGFLAGFKAGLREGGYVEGETVAIEYRWAEGQIERLPEMAADLVRRGVAVIATAGAEFPALAAKAATKTIPVVFAIGGDPVVLGLVPSLARPAGNVTGVTMLTLSLESKRFGLLREMIPKAKTIAAMINPTRLIAQAQADEVRTAAAQAGVELVIVEVSKEAELQPAFAHIVAQGAGALQVCAHPFFLGRRQQIITLASHHRIPAMYDFREFAEAGGLMTYGTDLADGYRQSGVYVARILKGARPDDLPVVQTTRFEFVINLVTAHALGLDIAPTMLARADSVIE